MNDYISSYEKSIKYSLLPQKDHIINMIHSDPNNSPVFADAIEEQDLHHDNETLEHLRNENGPFRAEKKNGKIKVRAVRPVYGHLQFIDGQDYHELPQELVDNLGTPEGNQRLLDHVLSSGESNENPEYLSESAAGHSDRVYHSGNFVIAHNPRLEYLAFEHKKSVPLSEYKQIKRNTEQRYDPK